MARRHFTFRRAGGRTRTMKSTNSLALLAALGLAYAGNAAADDTLQAAPAQTATPAAPASTPAPASPPSAPIALLKTIVPGTWNTSAELGAISTTGNTQGTSVTGKIDAKQELESWSNEYIANGYYAEDKTTLADGSTQDVASADRYALSAKAAYKLLNGGQKLFVLASFTSDKFGAFTKYSSISVGHSAPWYKTPDKELDVDIGPGYFEGRLADGSVERGISVRAAASFKWQVSATALFTQTASVERATENTHSDIETALSTKIYDKMQMKAAFVARSDTNVPNQKKSTDTQTSLTLVYSF
jgi:putative salt-induced outer membrane protein